mmetsp:Transcript_28696/g.24099  ORF Transcript_28696/g.24099 Transcript_28696/m.24099 type:complete len:122 (+) Transcript_28696:175-540(+)
MDFCPADNMLYTMGFDGIVIQWGLYNFSNNFAEVFLEKEFIVGQSFLDEQYNQEQRLQKKSEDAKKELEQKFKSDFDELKGTIEKLKEDCKNSEVRYKDDLHQLEHKKDKEKKDILDTHVK